MMTRLVYWVDDTDSRESFGPMSSVEEARDFGLILRAGHKFTISIGKPIFPMIYLTFDFEYIWAKCPNIQAAYEESCK